MKSLKKHAVGIAMYSGNISTVGMKERNELSWGQRQHGKETSKRRDG